MRKFLAGFVAVLSSSAAVAGLAVISQGLQSQVAGSLRPPQSFQSAQPAARPENPLQAVAPAVARADLALPATTDQAIVAPTVFDGPAPVAVAPPPQLAAPTASASTATGAGVWAVVIGVDDYPGTSGDLSAAVADANETYGMLRQFDVPNEQILVLKDGQVTDRTMDQASRWLADHAGPDSIAVFAFAGHIRALDSDTEALVGSDGSTYRDDELASALSGLQARQTWFMLAGCFAGGITEPLGPGRLLTAAADSQSLAYENPRMGRSYIVEYMIRRGLRNGEAGPNASVQDAYNWAHAEIMKDHPRRQPSMYMTAPVPPINLRAGISTPTDTGSGNGTGPQTPRRAASPPTTQAPPTTQPPRRCRIGVVFCGS